MITLVRSRVIGGVPVRTIRSVSRVVYYLSVPVSQVQVLIKSLKSRRLSKKDISMEEGTSGG